MNRIGTIIAAYPNTGGMAAEDHGIEICHPELGWLPIVVVNATEFAVTSPDLHLWFSLSDPAVSEWPMKNAGEFVRWCRRAAGGA